MEFRIFLAYLRKYFEYREMFQRTDSSGAHKKNFEEFQIALQKMKKLWVEINDNEA